MSRQRQGKIARLPHLIREDVNQDLLNGKSSGEILAWLNQRAEAIRVWDLYFEGAPATPQNLSEWRLGGYKEWLEEREKVERTKSLAAYAHKIAGAGGNISKGLQAILAGHILESYEVLLNADEGDEKPDDPVGRVQKLGGVVATMRHADIAQDRLELDKKKVAAKKEDQRLAREKFEKASVEALMKWAQTKEAQAILNSGAKKSVQMAELRKLMFGRRSETA